MHSTTLPRHARRHARLYWQDLRLPAAHCKVLGLLRYVLKEGDAQHISNAYVAKNTGYSEGYISVIMRQLAGEAISMRAPRPGARIIPLCATPIIRRVWTDRGWEIAMLPPPEKQMSNANADSSDLQQADPPSNCAYSATGSDETPQKGDQQVKAPIIIESCMQGEERPAPSPRTSCPEPQPESAADPLAGTIYEICKIVPCLATVRQRSQVAQTAGLLASVGATPDDARRAARWFTKHDWRGQKGETPTPALLREVWGQVPKREAIPLAPPRPTMPAEPDLTPAQLRAKLAALGITPGRTAPAPGWSPWEGGRRE